MNIIELLGSGKRAQLKVDLTTRDKIAGALIEAIPGVFEPTTGRQPTLKDAVDVVADNLAWLRGAVISENGLESGPHVDLSEKIDSLLEESEVAIENWAEARYELLIDALWWIVTISALPAEPGAVTVLEENENERKAH